MNFVLIELNRTDPLIDLASALPLLIVLDNCMTRSPYDKYASSFCLTALFISVGRQQNATLKPRQFSGSSYDNEMCERLYEPDAAGGLSTHLPIQKLAHANTAIMLFAYFLFQTPVYGAPARNQLGGTNSLVQPPRSLQLPLVHNIPFSSMMELVLPFGPDSSKTFATCHLPKVTSREFFEDGEWVGFYSYGHGRMTFDPPMHGIRFRARYVSLDKTKLELHATGTDSVGGFELNGQVMQDGKATLVKRYWPGPIWHWASIVTPFGIVGTWGGNGELRIGGWFWLWKASWSGNRQ